MFYKPSLDIVEDLPIGVMGDFYVMPKSIFVSLLKNYQEYTNASVHTSIVGTFIFRMIKPDENHPDLSEGNVRVYQNVLKLRIKEKLKAYDVRINERKITFERCNLAHDGVQFLVLYDGKRIKFNN